MSEGGAPEANWPEWVKDWIIPYVDDSILWPVAVSLLGHVVVVIVPLMLDIYRTASLYSFAVLLALLVGTGWLMRLEWRAIGRPGALSAVLGVMWLVSFPFAWLANSTGVF